MFSTSHVSCRLFKLSFVCLFFVVVFFFTGITSGPYAQQVISFKASTELKVTGCITLKKESAASLLAFPIHTQSVSTKTLVIVR